jgi:hypothetical protein
LGYGRKTINQPPVSGEDPKNVAFFGESSSLRADVLRKSRPSGFGLLWSVVK